MTADDDELAYYRAVEDLFASLRGVPHPLSPKDFQLLRQWWRDRVPLAAVTSGVTEVFARRREQDDDDPVTSLGYCRHAVRRHARRLAEMRVGAPDASPGEETAPDAAVADLAADLAETAAALPPDLRAVGEVIQGVARQLGELDGLPPSELDEHLFNLETALIEGCWTALPADRRHTISEAAEESAAGSGAVGTAHERTVRAQRDRELRRLLSLPRLELR